MTQPFQIEVFVPGIPKGQPRPRAFARKFGAKWSARVYDPGTSEGWKGAVAVAVQQFRPPSPLEGPVGVQCDFLFPRPGRLLKKSSPEGEIPHISKPDRDNCDKAVLDALTQLGFFHDDSQVCRGAPTKNYVAKGDQSGMRLRVWQVEA